MQCLHSFSFIIVSVTLFCAAQLKPCSDTNDGLTSQIPYDPSANVSACCWPGGECKSNFYCHRGGPGDQFDRVGGCTDSPGNDPACPPPLLREPVVWNWFGHTQNTTSCGDGTFCMNPGNGSCCFDGKGVKEITYHNSAIIPTVAAAWTTYYEDAGYSIPATTSDASTSTTSDSKSTPTSFALTTLAVQSQSLNDTTLPSFSQPIQTNTPKQTQPTTTTTTNLSPRDKAIIGTMGAVGALGILGAIGSLYLFRRSRTTRSNEHESKARVKAISAKDTKLTGPRALGEMDAWERRVHEAPDSGLNELTGQRESEERAELYS